MILTPTKLDLPIMRLPDWPAHDRAAWEAATTNVGWFADGGPLALYSQNRICVFESAYGRWLSFLVSYPNRSMNVGGGLKGADANLGSIDAMSTRKPPGGVLTVPVAASSAGVGS